MVQRTAELGVAQAHLHVPFNEYAKYIQKTLVADCPGQLHRLRHHVRTTLLVAAASR